MDSCHSVRRKGGLICAISRDGAVLTAVERAFQNVALKAENVKEKCIHLTAFM